MSGSNHEEDLSRLQDILDAVVAGRVEGHTCPFCGKGTLKAEYSDEYFVRLECPKCGKYFEGELA